MKTTIEYVHKSQCFYGNKISQYGLQNGYVDYATLAKSFEAVLANDLIAKTQSVGYWEIVNGCEYDEESDTWTDIYQYYVIDSQGAQILEELTDEIVFYNEELDLYVWGVTHYGTSWSYVLTNIKVEV